jgi:hypothetical protein
MARPTTTMLIDGGGLTDPLTNDPFKQDDDSTTMPSMTSWIVNLLKNVPQLKAIYDSVRDPATGKFLYAEGVIVDMITSSDWYLSNGPTVAAAVAGKYKYGDKWYNQNISEYKITISSIASSLGLDLKDPTIASYLSGLAETSFLNGWDKDYIENTIVQNKSIFDTAGAGAYAQQMQDIQSYANLMGIPLSQQTMTDYQRRLVGEVTSEGLRITTSPDKIKKELADKQALLYPMFADDFAAGRTLWDVTSLQRKKWADLLEVDEDTLDWNDPLWKDGKIFTMVDEKTGKVVQRPAWDAEKLIKQDERWQYTENAARMYEDIGIKFLNKFGFTAV